MLQFLDESNPTTSSERRMTSVQSCNSIHHMSREKSREKTPRSRIGLLRNSWGRSEHKAPKKSNSCNSMVMHISNGIAHSCFIYTCISIENIYLSHS